MKGSEMEHNAKKFQISYILALHVYYRYAPHIFISAQKSLATWPAGQAVAVSKTPWSQGAPTARLIVFNHCANNLLRFMLRCCDWHSITTSAELMMASTASEAGQEKFIEEMPNCN